MRPCSLHHKHIFLETLGPTGQCAVSLQGKRVAFKHNFVLAAHQMRIHQRQAGRQTAFAHHHFTLAALADVKRRRIDDHQQFSAGLPAQARGFFKPGILANQQAYADGVVALAGLKNAGALAGREITALVKHLVIGQLAFGVGFNDAAFAQHAGGIVALLHLHAFGVQAQAAVAVGRRAHHHSQAL